MDRGWHFGTLQWPFGSRRFVGQHSDPPGAQWQGAMEAGCLGPCRRIQHTYSILHRVYCVKNIAIVWESWLKGAGCKIFGDLAAHHSLQLPCWS